MAVKMSDVRKITVQDVAYRYQFTSKRTGRTVTRTVTTMRTAPELEQLKSWLPKHGGELLSIGPARQTEQIDVYF